MLVRNRINCNEWMSHEVNTNRRVLFDECDLFNDRSSSPTDIHPTIWFEGG